MAVLALSFAVVGVFAQEEGAILGEYGAITVKMINGKKTALISGTSTEAVEISEDVEVDSIYYDRDYSGEWGKPGTLMLPFDFPNGCLSEFGQIYEMTGIEFNGTSETWQIDTKTMGSNGNFEANRPYFVRPKRSVPIQSSLSITGNSGACIPIRLGKRVTLISVVFMVLLQRKRKLMARPLSRASS